MKRMTALLLAALFAVIACGCGISGEGGFTGGSGSAGMEGAVDVRLSDDGVTVDGAAAPVEADAAVYTARDIIYYEAGRGITYGEGSAGDEHDAAEAAAHTVVHITRPGTYVLSGSLSAGQVAVDLGEGAEESPEAVVTLILNGVDITCTVAPAVIFYRVYECGTAEADTASAQVDTSAAGANVVIADGTVNSVTGSYVARIYRSCTLSEDGSQVVDSKKLHKYDGAFYSRMSMNVDGGVQGTGVLSITAENEGLDTELHLTINGGTIDIRSGNDGINTNEDHVSVTTVNGGTLRVQVTGETGEGDGIDSNGWLVINGGTVTAMACSGSMDSGLDADEGILINGGSVLATGNMYDRIDSGGQACAVFSFARRQAGGTALTLRNSGGSPVAEWTPDNDFTCLVYSAPDLVPGDYTLWQGETQLEGGTFQNRGGPGMAGNGRPPEGMPEPPDGRESPGEMPEHPERQEPSDGMPESPDGQEPPERMPDSLEGRESPGEMPDFSERRRPDGGQEAEQSPVFSLTEAGGFFGGVAPAEERES